MIKNKKLKNNGLINKLLNWGYSRAISGFGGADSAYELANDYLNTKGTLEEQVNRLIKWQITKSATNGFITGLGGISFMPITLPANIVGVMYIQIRMITAIAHMGGHDIKSDQVKSLVYICMVGNGAKEILKDMGIKAGEKFAGEVIKSISTKTLSSINEKVSSGVASKLAGKGFSKLGKVIPLAGGFIGSAFDATSTKIAGEIAKKIFINNSTNIEESEPETPEDL
jgi:uncharacterized protein (DUF697 family)